jgi:hypothetical protein
MNLKRYIFNNYQMVLIQLHLILQVFSLIEFTNGQAPPIQPDPIPSSPFGNAQDICVQTNGVKYSVGGFPSSPYKITPFTETFKNPPVAIQKERVCRADGHCMLAYDFIIGQTQLRPFDNTIDSCKNFPGTWFMTYNGMAPGPTIRMPVGHESLVRFKNLINTNTGYFKGSYNPCLPVNGRIGRPISVHFHGSASLAPFDGWAEDETCYGEVKDYVYPNNRAGTGWYHDHALHITADNAYYGLAGLKITSAKVKDGGCGEPWNLEDIEKSKKKSIPKAHTHKARLERLLRLSRRSDPTLLPSRLRPTTKEKPLNHTLHEQVQVTRVDHPGDLQGPRSPGGLPELLRPQGRHGADQVLRGRSVDLLRPARTGEGLQARALRQLAG